MNSKGFAGVLLLIIGTLAAVLLYIAFVQIRDTKETGTSPDSSPTTPNSLTPSISPNTKTSPTSTPNKSGGTTTVPLQYTISPTRSYANTSYPTSQPVSTATPSPTGKGKGNGGGGGIVTGG